MKEPYAEFVSRAAKRRQQARKLREQGATYLEIAVKLGCSRQRASQLVHHIERASK